MDETPVFFDNVRNITMEKVNTDEVRLKTTGGDKKMATCCLRKETDSLRKELGLEKCKSQGNILDYNEKD